MKTQSLSLVLCLLLAACGAETESRTAQPMSAANVVAAAEIAASAPQPAAASALTADTQTLINLPEAAERRLSVQADIMFRTDNVRKTSQAINDLTAKYGGFVLRNNINSHTEAEQDYRLTDGNMVRITRYQSTGDSLIRIPRLQAAAFLKDLQPHIRLLQSQQFEAEDLEWSLLQQTLAGERHRRHAERVDALPAKRSDAEQGKNLAAESSEIQGRQDEARLQQAILQDRASFANIALHFEQMPLLHRENFSDTEYMAAQLRPPFAVRLLASLTAGWDMLITVLLWLLRFWWLYLMIAAGVSGWRYYRRPAPVAEPAAQNDESKQQE